MAESYRYAAFISYTHADADLARRLHLWLETLEYGRPAGSSGGGLYPIFLDEEEFPSGPLERISSEIDASRYFILIASKASADSRWVQREIEHFLSTRDAASLFPILVDVDFDFFVSNFLPPHLGKPEEDFSSTFAPSVSVFGENGAFLRLAAGLLGVNVGQLSDRQAQRAKASSEEQRARVREVAELKARTIAAEARAALVNRDVDLALRIGLVGWLETARVQVPAVAEVEEVLRAAGGCPRTLLDDFAKVVMSPSGKFALTHVKDPDMQRPENRPAEIYCCRSGEVIASIGPDVREGVIIADDSIVGRVEQSKRSPALICMAMKNHSVDSRLRPTGRSLRR